MVCVAHLRHDSVVMMSTGLSERDLARLTHEQMSENMAIIADGQNDIVGAAAVVVDGGCCPWDPDKFVVFARRCECEPRRDRVLGLRDSQAESLADATAFSRSSGAAGSRSSQTVYRGQGIDRKLAPGISRAIAAIDCSAPTAHQQVSTTVRRSWNSGRLARNASRFAARKRRLSDFDRGGGDLE